MTHNMHVPKLRPKNILRGFLAIIMIAGCGLASGEKVVTEQNFPVTGVKGVTLDIPGDLHITQEGKEILVVRAEPKVLAKITATVRDGILHIGAKEGDFQTQRAITLRLSVGSLSELRMESAGSIYAGPLRSEKLRMSLSGSGTIDVQGVTAHHLMVDLTGAGEIKVGGGRVTEQVVNLEGAGDYSALPLKSYRGQITLSGSGRAKVTVTGDLAATISGSGEIVYSGRPKLSASVSGAGEVVSIGER